VMVSSSNLLDRFVETLLNPLLEEEVMRFIDILRKHMPELVARYKVKSLGVFGSYVRNKQKKGGHLDLLLEFYEPPSLFQFIHLEHYLSDFLGVEVMPV